MKVISNTGLKCSCLNGVEYLIWVLIDFINRNLYTRVMSSNIWFTTYAITTKNIIQNLEYMSLQSFHSI